MTLISKETATDIAMAYRELEVAEKLLQDVRDTVANGCGKDIRDVFGRTQHGLQLGVPSGDTGHRLFNVEYTLAIPVIEAHIAHHKARLAALSEKARLELLAGDIAGSARSAGA